MLTYTFNWPVNHGGLCGVGINIKTGCLRLHAFPWLGFISSGTLGIQSGKQRQLHFTCQSRSHKEEWIAVKHAKALGTTSLITFILAQSIALLYHLDKNCEKSTVQTKNFLTSLSYQSISRKDKSPYRKQQISERAWRLERIHHFPACESQFYKEIIWTDIFSSS